MEKTQEVRQIRNGSGKVAEVGDGGGEQCGLEWRWRRTVRVGTVRISPMLTASVVTHGGEI